MCQLEIRLGLMSLMHQTARTFLLAVVAVILFIGFAMSFLGNYKFINMAVYIVSVFVFVYLFAYIYRLIIERYSMLMDEPVITVEKLKLLGMDRRTGVIVVTFARMAMFTVVLILVFMGAGQRLAGYSYGLALSVGHGGMGWHLAIFILLLTPPIVGAYFLLTMLERAGLKRQREELEMMVEKPWS